MLEGEGCVEEGGSCGDTWHALDGMKQNGRWRFAERDCTHSFHMDIASGSLESCEEIREVSAK